MKKRTKGENAAYSRAVRLKKRITSVSPISPVSPCHRCKVLEVRVLMLERENKLLRGVKDRESHMDNEETPADLFRRVVAAKEERLRA